MRRRRGPGLLATAVVVGGAAHVGASSANKQAAAQANAQAQQAQMAAQSQQIAELQAQQAAAAAPAPAPAAAAPVAAEAVDSQMAELQKLASLHTQGILTDEEFAAAKAKALGISAPLPPPPPGRTHWPGIIVASVGRDDRVAGGRAR